MGKGMYIGDSSEKARKVKKIYIGGADEKAHKVKKVYIGDANGKARLAWQSGIDMLLVTSSAFANWYISKDLQTFEAITNLSYGMAPFITYGNEVFLTLIKNTSSVSTPCNTSSDGVTWKSSVVRKNFASMEFLLDRFVFYDTTTVYYNYSINGLDWTYGTNKVSGLNSSNYGINAMTRGNGFNVLCSTGGGIYTTTDNGENLTLRTVVYTTYSNDITSITYGNGRFVAVGTNAYYWYSDNGTTWTKALVTSQSRSYDFNCVVYGNGMYVASFASQKMIAYSTTGTSWKFVNTNAIVNSIVFKDKFYCVSSDGTASYSTNGTEWTLMSGTSGTTYRIAYSTDGGGKYEYTN